MNMSTLFNALAAIHFYLVSFLQAPNLPNPEFIEDMFLLPRSKAKQVCLINYTHYQDLKFCISKVYIKQNSMADKVAKFKVLTYIFDCLS